MKLYGGIKMKILKLSLARLLAVPLFVGCVVNQEDQVRSTDPNITNVFVSANPNLQIE